MPASPARWSDGPGSQAQHHGLSNQAHNMTRWPRESPGRLLPVIRAAEHFRPRGLREAIIRTPKGQAGRSARRGGAGRDNLIRAPSARSAGNPQCRNWGTLYQSTSAARPKRRQQPPCVWNSGNRTARGLTKTRQTRPCGWGVDCQMGWQSNFLSTYTSRKLAWFKCG
jgi:hypothetical protein